MSYLDTSRAASGMTPAISSPTPASCSRLSSARSAALLFTPFCRSAECAQLVRVSPKATRSDVGTWSDEGTLLTVPLGAHVVQRARELGRRLVRARSLQHPSKHTRLAFV